MLFLMNKIGRLIDKLIVRYIINNIQPGIEFRKNVVLQFES